MGQIAVLFRSRSLFSRAMVYARYEADFVVLSLINFSLLNCAKNALTEATLLGFYANVCVEKSL